ncbi:MAG: FkbM family methyltransferase [Bacteroidales bacterium]|nr:FkbM family methyltransferase [Bacteroidales bacterium]
MFIKELIKKTFNLIGVSVIRRKYYDSLCNFHGLSFLDDKFILSNYFNKNRITNCFDVGANIGLIALKLNKNFPDAHIYCFELIKNTYEKLVNNVRKNSKIKTFNFAFGSEEGEAEVFHQPDNRWNSLNEAVNDIQKNNKNSISEIVKVKKIDNFCAENNIDKINILKTDTQGFELDVLKGAKNYINKKKIDFIYVEVGFDANDTQLSNWIDVYNYLNKNEYLFFGFFESCFGKNKNLHFSNALFASKSVID